MLIKRLIVRKTKPKEEVIRDIEFNLNGLNLIVDNTNDESTQSGNNVGKTTAIKIIDLCLGGKSPKTLYYDDDTKSVNDDIEKFLNENKVVAELILVEKKDSEEEISIKRGLYNRGPRIIDDEEYKNEEFERKLKNLIFGSDEKHPTLRQLVPKFIRINDNTDYNLIKFLPGMVTKDTYDTVYLFLFGILRDDLLSKKDSLATDLRECQKKIKILEKDKNIISISILQQRQNIIDTELEELYNKRNKLDYIDEYKEELENKRNLTLQINNIENKLQFIEYEINIIKDNISDLNKESKSIDIESINYIYKEAQAYIGELNKTFDEVVNFHSNMIKNRMEYILNKFENKDTKRKKLIEQRDKLIEKQKQINIELLDEGLLDELNNLNKKIEDLSVQKGEVNQSIKLLSDAKNEEKKLIDDLNKVAQSMSPENIENRMNKFNKYFSNYCNLLYKEKYLFTYDIDWKSEKRFPVYMDSFNGKVGTGMKKGIIVAFDLAYIDYSHKMNIKCPKFEIHDKLENTHINQLNTIFNICDSINGQYIVPILKERINSIDKKLVKKSTILELSKDDKFFRV